MEVSKEFVEKMKDSVVVIHDSIIAASGGEGGVRDDGGVYHSVYAILNSEKKFDDPVKLGAFVLAEFARKHHFCDGNKRTAYSLAKIMMLANRRHLVLDYRNALDFIVRVAEYRSEVSDEDIVEWLRENSKDVVREKVVKRVRVRVKRKDLEMLKSMGKGVRVVLREDKRLLRELAKK